MNSIKRLGIIYGRLGLATDPGLIERRAEGVRVAADNLQIEDLPGTLRCAFGLSLADGDVAFLASFDKDPTFDVQPGDREAALLAAAVLDCEIENESTISSTVALAVITAAAGGARQPAAHDQLLSSAESMLAHFQGQGAASPSDQVHQHRPATIAEALASVTNSASHYFQQSAPHVVTALEEIGKYAEANALASVKKDNEILKYVRRLEEELRTYWWVSGGWSSDAARPFRQLDLSEAAIRAGKELADVNKSTAGLFAAPALLDMIIERGRSGEVGQVTLREAAVLPDRSWRRSVFGPSSGGKLADLLPVSSALGLAASSEDADDWQPRFQRSTGIDIEHRWDAVQLGVQVYRERLAARALT